MAPATRKNNMIEYITLTCSNEKCGKDFDLPLSKYKYKSEKRKQKNFYCNEACYADKKNLIMSDPTSTFRNRKSIFTPLFIRMGENARAKKLPKCRKCELAELWYKQEGKCAITGIPMILEHNHQPHQASVDRINSDGTYEIDNIQIVCLAINYMKNGWSQETINKFIQDMVNNLTHDQMLSV